MSNSKSNDHYRNSGNPMLPNFSRSYSHNDINSVSSSVSTSYSNSNSRSNSLSNTRNNNTALSDTNHNVSQNTSDPGRNRPVFWALNNSTESMQGLPSHIDVAAANSRQNASIKVSATAPTSPASSIYFNSYAYQSPRSPNPEPELSSPIHSSSSFSQTDISRPSNNNTNLNRNQHYDRNKGRSKRRSNHARSRSAGASLTGRKKKNIFTNFTDKNRKNRGMFPVPVNPIESSTIMEDDEGDQVLNVPMLPAFAESSTFNSNANSNDKKGSVPNPKQLSEMDNPFENNQEAVLFSLGSEQSLDDKIKNSSHKSLSKKDKYLNTTIDHDFDVNFSKDSDMIRADKILQLRKRGSNTQYHHRKPVTSLSSSSDDASTESSSGDDADRNDDGLKKYIPHAANTDNASIKSDSSHNIVKDQFKKIFRKRTFSFGAESQKSTKSVKSGKSGKSGKSNNIKDDTNNQNQNEKYRNASPSQEGSSSQEYSEKQHDIHENLRHLNDDSFNEKEEENADEGHKNSVHNDPRVSESTSSNHRGEHFLKNIFTMEGLLGGGGLTPNVNLEYNKKMRPGHDEENPPPNLQEEVNSEAQALVGHMFRNPLDELRKRKFTSRKNRQNRSQDDTINNNTAGNNEPVTMSRDDTSNAVTTGYNDFYVPEGAHLSVDPFDDLQNFDNYSIDVPENLKEKPRKYKSSIQSALLQLYNTHMIPSSETTSVSGNRSSFEGSTLVEPEFNDSTADLNDLHMNMGNEIRRNGLHNLTSHEATTALDAELPDLGSKLEEIGGDIKLGSKMHKRTSSLQNIIFGHHADKRTSSSSINLPSFSSNNRSNSNHYSTDNLGNGNTGTDGRKKAGVSFELPNFTKKPSAKNDEFTQYEKQELKGYKQLKKRAKFNKKLTRETRARITVHIADVLERQRFILTLCKAFMLYGAPTHRLEEYMSMTSQVLEIDGSFIYFPGCMLVSFGDLNARTSEMKLVRCAQGLDLGKLDEVHDIYKNVVHDRLGTVEGYELLDEIMNRKPKFNRWWCIFFYSVASVAVAPWSFGGSWIDLPICFGIGAIIAFLQFVIAPKNTLYSSVFEVTSSIVASFIARAIGSINGGNTFCYAALVQSPLALILPGYIILCGSLELQSRNIVAGSVRMFYAFIYSLMLSFGMTLGAALYGWLDSNATSATSCTSNISPWFYFLFIPLFTTGIALTNQASYSQLPMMSVISGCGYVVTYFSSKHFKEVTELNATLGCFILGLVSNIYSRLLKSFNKYFTTRGTFMTVSLMLPGIFVQVPSGIASQGSVFTGITTANSIVNSNSSSSTSTTLSNESALSFGMVMIQVALGISVGLYLSTIIVYPFGKKNTGLFTL